MHRLFVDRATPAQSYRRAIVYNNCGEGSPANQAPVKEYILVPRTGHDPNQIMVDAQYRVLKERVLPLVKE